MSDDTLLFSPGDLGVSEDAYMALGVSGKALLTMIIVSALLCFLPVIFSLRKVPGSIVSGGSNSLVLSAACHPSVMARHNRPLRKTNPNLNADDAQLGQSLNQKGQRDWRQEILGSSFTSFDLLSPSQQDKWSVQDETATERGLREEPREEDEGRLLLPCGSPEEQEEHELSLLRGVALGKVKWGAMAVDPDLLRSLNLDDIDGPVEHLGFGSEEDDVRAPQEGHFYI